MNNEPKTSPRQVIETITRISPIRKAIGSAIPIGRWNAIMPVKKVIPMAKTEVIAFEKLLPRRMSRRELGVAKIKERVPVRRSPRMISPEVKRLLFQMEISPVPVMANRPRSGLFPYR